MRRIAVLFAATAVALCISRPASASPIPRCVPIPDGDGHVWMLCR
jgi:hypothetical protein